MCGHLKMKTGARKSTFYLFIPASRLVYIPSNSVHLPVHFIIDVGDLLSPRLKIMEIQCIIFYLNIDYPSSIILLTNKNPKLRIKHEYKYKYFL